MVSSSRTWVVLLLAAAVAVVAVAGQHIEPGCPEPHGEQAYPHPELCDHFFLCQNGSLSVEQCGNGLLFDGKGNVHDHCNYNWAVDCGQRINQVEPISTPGCEYHFGIYPEAACSTHYTKCAHGIAERTECEPGLAYDEKSHSCNWPDLLLEVCNPEEIVGFKCPSKLPPGSPAAKFWPFPRFAVPGDCQRFITCVHGFPRLLTCEHGKLFDADALGCEEHVASCGNHLSK